MAEADAQERERGVEAWLLHTIYMCVCVLCTIYEYSLCRYNLPAGTKPCT
eukprot:SAG25_NODE_11016_length_316_cov_0.834101_1_plen_50_part_00